MAFRVQKREAETHDDCQPSQPGHGSSEEPLGKHRAGTSPLPVGLCMPCNAILKALLVERAYRGFLTNRPGI